MTQYSPDPSHLGGAASDLRAREALLARQARYSRWDGTQTLPDLEADEILAAMADDLMSEGDVEAALRRLMERGWRSGDPARPDMAGLQDLIQRLQQRRRKLLERYNLGDTLADIRAELDSIVADERSGVQRRLDEAAREPASQARPSGLGDRAKPQADPTARSTPASSDAASGSTVGPGSTERTSSTESTAPDGSQARSDQLADPQLRAMLREMAARRLDQLDGLPSNLGDRIRRLEEYDFLEPEAHRRFDELVERLRKQVLDQYMFGRLRRDAFGGHRLDRGGRGGEREETTKPYEFGDPFHLDLNRTLGNALQREENAPGRRTSRHLQLAPDDFEVFRTEQLTRTSTVLLVDMSRSMLLRGCFVAAKKVAIALNTLIRTEFPRDHLSVIGFAYYAREIRPESLAELSWHGYEYGTNLQHGLMLARRTLAREHGGNREIVVITDGEPTAHFENGQVEFSYPPTRRTIQETLREVVRCTKDGITINTFMLERSRALAEFVALITRLNRGRAFYATPERLGEYVLVDFVSRRTRKVT